MSLSALRRARTFEALRWYTSGFAQRTKIKIDLQVPQVLGRLPRDVEITLFRIVQESLTNVYRHSGSPMAGVHLEKGPAENALSIWDKGKGLPGGILQPCNPSSVALGVGIQGMEGRVRQLGGRMTLRSGHPGAVVEIFLPLAEGTAKAWVIFIGEMAGDAEDREGRPFAGPAGNLFDRLLSEAGINRKEVYVTNVVKHFKWEPRGKRRIHKTPNARKIAACKPWLEAEIASVRPEVIVCLGATAAKALFGEDFKVSERRGTFVESSCAPRAMATVHPSSILRAVDDAARQQAERQFVEDLKKLKKLETVSNSLQQGIKSSHE